MRQIRREGSRGILHTGYGDSGSRYRSRHETYRGRRWRRGDEGHDIRRRPKERTQHHEGCMRPSGPCGPRRCSSGRDDNIRGYGGHQSGERNPDLVNRTEQFEIIRRRWWTGRRRWFAWNGWSSSTKVDGEAKDSVDRLDRKYHILSILAHTDGCAVRWGQMS